MENETRFDWKNDGRASNFIGVQLGYVLIARFGVWVEPEIPYGPNQRGDWNLKFTFLWYDRKK